MSELITAISEANKPINLMTVICAVGVAALLGLVVFLTHRLTADEYTYDKNFGLVLLLVPAIVALFISVTGTVVRALSIAGVLAIVRYRSVLIKPRDLVYVFFSVAVGFVCGVDMYLAGLIFTVLICIIAAIYAFLTADKATNVKKTLKISVPESIDYAGLFDKVLDKYTSGHKLSAVKIVSGGTVTELTYAIRLKDEKDTKAFLDELRTLNANFKIALQEYAVEAD